MFERFSGTGRETFVRAAEAAKALGHTELGTGHLLLALLDERAGPVAEVLRSAGLEPGTVREHLVRPLFDSADAAALRSVGIDLDAVLARVTASFGPDALAGGSKRAGRRFPRVDKALAAALGAALQAAVARHDRSLLPEHLLLGLLDQPGSAAAALLADAHVDPAVLHRDVGALLDRAA